MKYVAICGGLGNQMFQYAYLLMLKNKGYNVSAFIPSNKWEHIGGFELKRAFGIDHKQSIWECLYQLGFPFTRLFTFVNKTYFGKNFKINKEDFSPPKKYGYFYGTWQSEKYLINRELIQNTFTFNERNLSKQTIDIAKLLRREGITISVHIRRGDYQSAAFSNGFGSCCTLEYYHNGISYMDMQFPNTTYVFFSDDMQWVKDNIKVDNAIYVDHNNGVDSWQDMYLMSLCSHNIIANSTFSWWAAWLNNNPEKIVIAPKKWWNSIENDDVVPESWIRK